MFDRPDDSYQIDTLAIDRILADQVNPLCLISDLIPSEARVLDVGGGNGILPLLLRRLGKAVVIDGVEPSAAAALMAAEHYNVFIQGTLNDLPHSDVADNGSPWKAPTYDYIVLADVIEHTNDPVSLLKQASRFLSPGGKVLVSVPNVSFAPIRCALMAGEWTYTDWGILERTHLRFFSKTGLLATLEASNLHVLQLTHLGRSPFQMEKQLQDYQLDLSSLLRLKRDPLAFTYQFLAVCSRDCEHDRGATLDEAWRGIDTHHFVRSYLRLRRHRLKRV